MSMDEFWLDAAFYQATRVIGNTGKNPPVGCVLVKDRELIGVGATSEGGRPHAEENAISMAGEKTKGSTMYVSLEPCNLDNNQSSCTKLILKSGIKKVVIGMLDPNPATYKKGYKELIKKKINVKIIKISLNNFLINYTHYCCNIRKRPMIALKTATSIDSKITHNNSSHKWITSSLSRSHVQQLRSLYDAVLVGTNTMLFDNPTLNTRIEGINIANTRIIFDSKLKIDLKSNLIKSLKKNPLLIFTSSKYNIDKYIKLRKLGVQIHKVTLNKKKNISIDKVLNSLNKTSIKSVLVEGGAKVATEFLNKKIVDIIFIYRADCFIGGEALNMFGKIDFNNDFELYNEVFLGSNKLEVWINKSLNQIYRVL